MRYLIAVLGLSSLVFNSSADSLMIQPGKLVLEKKFDSAEDVDKKSIKFNKETQHKVQDGVLKAIPPVIAYEGTGKKSKWAKSSFSRVNFPELPKDYICTFRVKINQPKDAKAASKAKAYFDMGHRCIRTTLSGEGTKFLLENHLVGKKEKETSKLLQEISSPKLTFNQWYEITAEVKGTEALIQINGQVLYGQNGLISGERANTFNIDISGAGYELDYLKVWQAGDLKESWPQKKKALVK
jgi:hypothetical protein